MDEIMSNILELNIISVNDDPSCEYCDCADPCTGSENCGCEDF